MNKCLVLCLFVLSAVLSVSAKDDGSEKIFRDKCVKCHEITKLEIKAEPRKPDTKITDLSATTFETQDAVVVFLKRESELNGKKHKAKFSGTDEELLAMAAWIWSLKEQ